MQYFPPALENLVEQFARLPGVGVKSAQRLAFHIIKESDSFEDAIRKAILYGGDSDTLGAIVGSLAKARFGVNLTTIEAAMSYLPEDMRNVIKKFYATY